MNIDVLANSSHFHLKYTHHMDASFAILELHQEPSILLKIIKRHVSFVALPSYKDFPSIVWHSAS